MLADGFSLEFEWQQVSSSLQDPSQYYADLSNFVFILLFTPLEFLLIIIRSGLLAWIRWSVCMLKSHRSLCESFSRTGAGLYIYHLFVWSNWNFLHISLWITLPTQSCLALYSFCANLLHSLIMWLIVSSLSPHSLHLLFCCVLSILALIWLVLMKLSCDAIRRDSVSLFIIIIMSRRQRGYPWPSLSFIASGRSSGLHPVSSHSCCMYVRAGRPTLAHPYVGVHRSTSLMSSSLLLQQCPACLVRRKKKKK